MTDLIVLFIAATSAGAECARRRRLVHHPSVADADRHGCARGQHHLDRCAVSRTARHRLHRPGRRGEPDWAQDADVSCHQPHWRGARRAHSPRHAAGDLRPSRAVAGAVRDRALRLGRFLSPSSAARRKAFAALGRGRDAVFHRRLWRLFRRRHRTFDDGRADHDGFGGSQRGRGEERSRGHNQRLCGCDLRLFQGRALAAGARHRDRAP